MFVRVLKYLGKPQIAHSNNNAALIDGCEGQRKVAPEDWNVAGKINVPDPRSISACGRDRARKLLNHGFNQSRTVHADSVEKLRMKLRSCGCPRRRDSHAAG